MWSIANSSITTFSWLKWINIIKTLLVFDVIAVRIVSLVGLPKGDTSSVYKGRCSTLILPRLIPLYSSSALPSRIYISPTILSKSTTHTLFKKYKEIRLPINEENQERELQQVKGEIEKNAMLIESYQEVSASGIGGKKWKE